MSGLWGTGIPFRLPSSAAGNNATLVKASEGQVHHLIGYNSNAAVRYLKLYNKATAPTVGTDVPWLTIALPPSTAFSLPINGVQFPRGIGFGLVTGAADNDNTAPGAGEILGLNIIFS